MKQHGKTFGLVLAALVAGVILGSLSIAFAGPQKAAGPAGLAGAAAVAPVAGCPMSDGGAGAAVCGGGECARAAECDGACDVTGEPCGGACDGAACGQAAAAGACGAMAPEATF